MNTPHQVHAVKAILEIKNRILMLTDWDEIAALLQKAIEIGSSVPAKATYTLDKTTTPAWNLISVKRSMMAVKARIFDDIESAHFQVAASLLMLSMAIGTCGFDDIIKIAA